MVHGFFNFSFVQKEIILKGWTLLNYPIYDRKTWGRWIRVRKDLNGHLRGALPKGGKTADIANGRQKAWHSSRTNQRRRASAGWY
jgi:hypothetical protein